jgi:hypothetical protein
MLDIILFERYVFGRPFLVCFEKIFWNEKFRLILFQLAIATLINNDRENSFASSVYDASVNMYHIFLLRIKCI